MSSGFTYLIAVLYFPHWRPTEINELTRRGVFARLYVSNGSVTSYSCRRLVEQCRWNTLITTSVHMIVRYAYVRALGIRTDINNRLIPYFVRAQGVTPDKVMTLTYELAGNPEPR